MKSKLDVLCENAFLIALGLPPRVNHLAEDGEDLELNLHKVDNSVDSYCKWLEGKIRGIIEIPIEKASDKEFVINYLCRNPIAIPSLAEELRNEEDFMLELISNDPYLVREFLAKFPELHKNNDFMLKLMTKNNLAFTFKEAAESTGDFNGYLVKYLKLTYTKEQLVEMAEDIIFM
jgi:hypothetical protein